MWTYTITEFKNLIVGISNFMLFVNKQTFDVASNAWKHTIDNNYGKLALKYFFSSASRMAAELF